MITTLVTRIRKLERAARHTPPPAHFHNEPALVEKVASLTTKVADLQKASCHGFRLPVTFLLVMLDFIFVVSLNFLSYSGSELSVPQQVPYLLYIVVYGYYGML